ncbi:hypothetical protein, partial [Nocardia tengchongensis]|uniref:hypothetical protein n=1 Tax=Nocardia tengchongensis TaxID=2055889 RepID=UPI0036988A1A
MRNTPGGNRFRAAIDLTTARADAGAGCAGAARAGTGQPVTGMRRAGDVENVKCVLGYGLSP